MSSAPGMELLAVDHEAVRRGAQGQAVAYDTALLVAARRFRAQGGRQTLGELAGGKAGR